ncbi:hypothetical protein A5784_15800 [Mycobacterium sp. 852013-50091_SCH5140682]|uniref:DUF4307 domain-containing protein n=1 Tax=Mycobacterium sp. 852013-50091_SCH5140682 TaxID=1834109 RepID=UPI0007EB5F86|nr:DUF4307 domain-containing protein [Mycobacterium sp. 852013-50091_SCH5140682]OBC02379.1 hypothetical protein A5784_15800 [Mycobacterium sp. 852013-50091_SCH5140682]
MIERPVARYGRQSLPRRNRRWILAALLALVVAAGVVLAIAAWHKFANNDVKGELTAYELVGDDSVSVTIGVTRPDPSRPVVCIVRARSLDGGETGRREILVGPSTQKTVQVTAVVKSSKPPVVGDVYGCGTDVPSYLVAP